MTKFFYYNITMILAYGGMHEKSNSYSSSATCESMQTINGRVYP